MRPQGVVSDGEAPVDVAIVGGGLAGLSLACHLLSQGFAGRLLVLEGRKSYVHDRFWCSWSAPDHPFRECVTATWRQWRVGHGGAERIQASDGQPYQCIPSGLLYAEAARRIKAAANAELRLDCQVVAVDDHGDHAEVSLADGTRVRAAMAFDSRLPSPHPRGAAAPDVPEVDWVQDFLGWRVRTERPVFDPQTVTLMQFASRRDDVRFVYVLPFSATEALVEATAFAPGAVAEADHATALRAHMGDLSRGGDYVVVDQERGCVPMSTRRAPTVRPGARVVPIGTAAGMVKASTGYSFEAVQRWSAAVASELVAGRALSHHPARSFRSSCMDRMFLAFMRRHPERMPSLFLRLFERVPAEAMVRFLSDRASLRDVTNVVMAMPVLPMLVEAARSLRLWARSA